MKHALALAIPIVALLACSSPGEPAKAAPNERPRVDRYTNDIWPAVGAYNTDRSQGGKAYQAFTKIMAPDMNPDQYGVLRNAAQALGRNTEYDENTCRR